MCGEKPHVVAKLVTVTGLPDLSAQDPSCCCSSVELDTVGTGDEETETLQMVIKT